MKAFKDISTVWAARRASYQGVGSEEDLLEKSDTESDFEAYPAAVIASYRRLTAFLSGAIVLLTTGLVVLLLTRKPTDAQCGAQLSIWCRYNSLLGTLVLRNAELGIKLPPTRSSSISFWSRTTLSLTSHRIGVHQRRSLNQRGLSCGCVSLTCLLFELCASVYANRSRP